MLLDPFESQLKKDGVGSDEFMDISLSLDCTFVDGNAGASSRNHYLCLSLLKYNNYITLLNG